MESVDRCAIVSLEAEMQTRFRIRLHGVWREDQPQDGLVASVSDGVLDIAQTCVAERAHYRIVERAGSIQIGDSNRKMIDHDVFSIHERPALATGVAGSRQH